jgi:hypothetical protein
MITLIYGSSATNPIPSDELLAILEEARIKNAEKNITGMLLYDDGNFLQVLEGEDEVVTSLYNKICGDPRHQSIMLYVKKTIDKRNFDDWAMGFVDVQQLDVSNIKGYSRFLNDPEHDTKLEDASYAHSFLSVFRENIR